MLVANGTTNNGSRANGGGGFRRIDVNNSDVVDTGINSGQTVSSKGSDLNDIYSLINSANSSANELSIAEAEKNRNWQTWMSNTAHTREVEDLKNAGLNPVLSANSGASSGSGDSADIQSNSAAYAAIMTALINQQTQTQVANINAKSALKVAEQYGENSIDVKQWSLENPSTFYQLLGAAYQSAKKYANSSVISNYKRY